MGQASKKKLIVTVLVSLLSSFYFLPTARADQVHEILENARRKLESKSDQAHVVLRIIETDGEKKTLEMNIQTLISRGGFRAIVRMTAPAGDKGTALLTIVHGAKTKQWLYLPASNQIRRIAVANKSAGVLGSELSPEDLNPAAITGAKAKLISQNAKMAEVQITPSKGSSIYSKADIYFSLPSYLPEKTDYYIGKNLQKIVQFENYKVFLGHIYRACYIKIWNVVKKRGTNVRLSHVIVNGNLTRRDFTPDALKNVW